MASKTKSKKHPPSSRSSNGGSKTEVSSPKGKSASKKTKQGTSKRKTQSTPESSSRSPKAREVTTMVVRNDIDRKDTPKSKQATKKKKPKSTVGSTSQSPKVSEGTKMGFQNDIEQQAEPPRPSPRTPKEKDKARTQRYPDRKEDVRRRRFAVCVFIVCCFLILLVVGLVLGLVVFRDDDDNPKGANQMPGGENNGQAPSPNTGNPPSAPSPGSGGPPSPTAPSANVPSPAPVLPPFALPTPTRFPTTSAPIGPTPAPVPAPTSLLLPTSNRLVLVPFADTYVLRDGFDQFEAFGKDDSFLVQNGPRIKNEIPDGFGLLAFDASKIPSSFSSAVLQLFHVPANRNRGAAELSILQLPSTKLSIESLHGGMFKPDAETAIRMGPSFQVSPSDEIVQVDITNLVASNSESQLFLMIDNFGPEQPAGATGDRFRTRETNDPPQLIVFL